MAKKQIKTKKKKIQRITPKGRIYIQASFNNTIITITDETGNVISWSSAGSSGFKGTKKSTPFAASHALRNALAKAEPYTLQEVDIFVSGVGPGRDAAMRAIVGTELNVKSIKDITPMPHNGTKPKKPRRV